MANERITENFFRQFVFQDESYLQNKIIIEEQSSEDIKIDKLLVNASKSGGGKGYPEFIIRFKENPDFIVVVECKANIKHHSSCEKNKYKDYAVDGALLYSSFLSKEYDVLSIAISGDNKNNLKISHFLQLKETNEAHSIFKENQFLPLDDYLNGYKTSEKKFNQDFRELLKFSKILNDKLHTLKVPESNRSLLISGALIALSDKAFCNAYKFQKPKELAENLINTIKNKLTNVQNKHIEDIITTYSFITTHTILAKKENELRDIITEVDQRINNFIRTYKYFDTLGQFYIEFLRYANNDKGLGIVLTPPHITELFSEIACVNKDSVVIDTCTGTGGFLISAMKKMIIDVGGDNKKELNIKSKQIIGIEIQHSIFALTCSNMYIHGDGRSNLIKGSCFDEEIIEQVKKYKPNVGFLNPPYKSSKDDIEELEFILNNLSMLEKGSYCVAIIPQNRVTETKGVGLELKDKLLKNHTLEAVFSMPDELFVNSKAGTITCIIVLKAKEKHPENYKTYFGYWKNDGFIKRKTGGRADYNHQWNSIKKYWLDNFKNKEEIDGHSIKRFVTASDEWCVEAYMKTDYSTLNDGMFKNRLLQYAAYNILNEQFELLKIVKINKTSLSLKSKKWEYFATTDIFEDISIAKSIDLNKLESDIFGINYIGRTRENNGRTEKVELKNEYKKYINDGGCITVVMVGDSTCSSFFQSKNFFASQNLLTLRNKNINEYNSLFLSVLIYLEKYRFSYGRTLTKSYFENMKIKLPIDERKNPDWGFMENYIKSLLSSK